MGSSFSEAMYCSSLLVREALNSRLKIITQSKYHLQALPKLFHCELIMMLDKFRPKDTI